MWMACVLVVQNVGRREIIHSGSLNTMLMEFAGFVVAVDSAILKECFICVLLCIVQVVFD